MVTCRRASEGTAGLVPPAPSCPRWLPAAAEGRHHGVGAGMPPEGTAVSTRWARGFSAGLLSAGLAFERWEGDASGGAASAGKQRQLTATRRISTPKCHRGHRYGRGGSAGCPVPPSGPAAFGALPHDGGVHLDTQGDLRRSRGHGCVTTRGRTELRGAPGESLSQDTRMFGIAFSLGCSLLQRPPCSLPVQCDCSSRPARREHATTEVTSPREAALPPQQPL